MVDNQQVLTTTDDLAPVDPDDSTAEVSPTQPAAKRTRAKRAAGAVREARIVPDAVALAAVDLARAAAEESAGDTVGEHLGSSADGDRLLTHSFACLDPGYRGWRWAVTLARAPRARVATVCEVVLLPGDDALLAPEWLTWADRLAPGDLGSSDVLPYKADDPYLDQGYEATGDQDEDELAIWELGLGRPRVLSRLGREAAAERWYRGKHGPTADIAVHATAECSTCGYFLQLAGGLRQVFGVCGNEWSPQDGTVVSADHGCGAHSETDVEPFEAEPLPLPILDETGVEAVVVPRAGQPVELVTDPLDEPIVVLGATDTLGEPVEDSTEDGTEDSTEPQS